MSVDRPVEIVSWAEDPASLINEPENERTRGWPFGYLPPADQKNWLQRAVGRWIDHLSQNGSSFDSMAVAADALDVGGSATIRLPDDVDNRAYFSPLIGGLSPAPDSVFNFGALAVDGRRTFVASADTVNPFTSLVALTFEDSRIGFDVTGPGVEEDLIQDLKSDGKTLVARWQEFDGGSPTGDTRIEFYDAGGDLSSPVSAEVFAGSVETVQDVIAIGSHVVVATKNVTTDTITLYGFETENYTVDWELDLREAGAIAGGAFNTGRGGVASNGEFISVYVTDGTDRFVFFFNADGTPPDGSPSTDWPDVIGYAEILPTDAGIGVSAQSLWIGDTCYIGTGSAVGAGAISAVQLRELKSPSEYVGEIDPEIVWRGSSLSTGDYVASMTTDGRRIYANVTDSADNSDVVFVALDTLRREQRDIPGIGDDVHWLVEDYILQINDPDQDTTDAIACDGMYIWCVRGVIGSDPINRVDLLSTAKHAQKFHRVDGGSRFRRPFHNLLVPVCD